VVDVASLTDMAMDTDCESSSSSMLCRMASTALGSMVFLLLSELEAADMLDRSRSTPEALVVVPDKLSASTSSFESLTLELFEAAEAGDRTE
jgi:hypothetical protein